MTRKLSAESEKELILSLHDLKENSDLSPIRGKMIENLSKTIKKEDVEAVFNIEKSVNDLSTEEDIVNLIRVVNSFYRKDQLKIKNALRKVDIFYNEELKEDFLKDKGYKKETEEAFRMLFNKTEPMERALNKDLSNFNRDELEDLFRNLGAKTTRSLQTYISKINQYNNYSVSRGASPANKAKIYKSTNDIEQFLDDGEENMIFDRDEIMEIAEYSDNSQDGVIPALLFDGLSYKDKYVELVDLHKDMINMDDGLIYLPAREEGDYTIPERTIEMSEITKSLVERAMKDKEYVSVSGYTSRKYSLAESDYILRGTRSSRTKINWRNINQRILRLSEINDEESLTGRSISYSGQVYYATMLMKSGVAIEDAVKKVLQRFGQPLNNSSEWYLKVRVENYLKNNS
ncbi:hypothetical protein JR311_20410 (plasmid) [Bacillus velezensis]|uniref:phage lytic cycle repressor MrpR family protein n=1 Tax=Bacillus velezensis TaxID=492670 RepID=UPI00195F21EB|nr:hypothetical protein [Bacillus velezensis]QRV11387.1 hypothetical protein JR311_20410 [Bacillus velezensis]URJ76344.1 hypothetical protein MF619_004088 [Bacillus velezensis]URJ80464.1 hypothetical protein MF621_004050 [Bacillus velezensis]